MSFTVTLYFDNMVDETHFFKKKRMLSNAEPNSRINIEGIDCIESKLNGWNDEHKGRATQRLQTLARAGKRENSRAF